MTQAAQLAQYGSNNVGLSFKNRIINGDMGIDQRNNGASVNASVVNASVYMLDRWRYYANTGASRFSYQQNAGSVTPPAGFTNYLGITSLTANSPASTDEYIISQFVEGFNSADLNWGTANAQTVTVSFWVRSSLTGNNFGACVKSANSGYTYPFNFSIPTANTWTFISTTIPGPTIGTFGSTNGVGLQLLFNLGTGSAYLAGASGAWTTTFSNAPTGSLNILGTNGATFFITGVQLEKGSVATSFDYLPYTTELQLCQRYYLRYQLTASFAFVGRTLDGNRVQLNFPLRNQMRTTPSLVSSGITAVNNVYFGTLIVSPNGAQTYDLTGHESQDIGGLLISGGGTYTGGQISTAQISGSIAYSAEL